MKRGRDSDVNCVVRAAVLSASVALVTAGCFPGDAMLSSELQECLHAQGMDGSQFDANQDGEIGGDELIAAVEACEGGEDSEDAVGLDQIGTEDIETVDFDFEDATSSVDDDGDGGASNDDVPGNDDGEEDDSTASDDVADTSGDGPSEGETAGDTDNGVDDATSDDPTEIEGDDASIVTSDNATVLEDDTWRFNVVSGDWAQDDDGTMRLVKRRTGAVAWTGERDWLDYTYRVEMKAENHGDAGLIFRSTSESPRNDSGKHYYVGLYPAKDRVVLGHMNGRWNVLKAAQYTLDANEWYKVEVEVTGDRITIYVDGDEVIDGEWAMNTQGAVGLRSYRSIASYRNFEIDVRASLQDDVAESLDDETDETLDYGVELVRNGGFEKGTEDWEEYQHDNRINGFHTHNFGANGMTGHLHGHCQRTAGGIVQSLQTLEGETYVLALDAYSGTWSGAVDDVVEITAGSLDVSVEVREEHAVNKRNPDAALALTYEFVALGDKTDLSFWAGRGHCIDIDNVSVRQVIDPVVAGHAEIPDGYVKVNAFNPRDEEQCANVTQTQGQRPSTCPAAQDALELAFMALDRSDGMPLAGFGIGDSIVNVNGACADLDAKYSTYYDGLEFWDHTWVTRDDAERLGLAVGVFIKPQAGRCDTLPSFECDESINFINGLGYSQTNLTDGCFNGVCNANPRYGATPDIEAAIAYCEEICVERDNCTGFFMQRHRNGHEICGFYSDNFELEGVWHGHQVGSRVCKLSKADEDEAALDDTEEDEASIADEDDANNEWERFASSQCTVETREYDGDRLDNPIFDGGGFIGQLTLDECQARCETDTDSKGRSCVAIEWSDAGQATSSSDTRLCALAWGCDSTKAWGGGSVFVREDIEEVITTVDDQPVTTGIEDGSDSDEGSGDSGGDVGAADSMSNDGTDTGDGADASVDLRTENLIVNGSFEFPALPAHTWKLLEEVDGWQLSSGAQFEIQNNVAGSPFDGEQHLELDSRHSTSVSQRVATVPGVRYRLSFAFSPRAGRSEQDNQMLILVDGVETAYVTADGRGLSDSAWQYYSMFITAESAMTKIEFSDIGISNSYGSYIDDVSLFVAMPSTPTYASCLDILDADPSAESGEYTIKPEGQEELSVICDMESDGGGWTLIADENYQEDACGGDWDQGGGKEYCTRANAGSSSNVFSNYGIEWSEVRVNMGIRSVSTTDAFGWHNRSEWSAEDNYVDGVSLTTGDGGAREHLFTYAVGHAAGKCPDTVGQKQPHVNPQAFVGSAYTCGYTNPEDAEALLFQDDWFVAQALDTGDRPIEVRLMADQGIGNENVNVYSIVLYIR